MKIISALFVAFVTFLSGCKSLVIDCSYNANPNYYCDTQNTHVTISKECREIAGIRGFHSIGKTNDDVQTIYYQSKTVTYFPRGITKYFKNIDHVHLHTTNLKEITKEDLKEFGEKLKIIKLYSVQIEIIEADLFTYNKNLELIYLKSNKIKHIANGVFDHLDKLSELYLAGNPCTSSADDADVRSKLITVIRSVEGNCKDQSYMFLEEKNAENKKLRKENEILREEIRGLKQNNCSCQ